MESNSDLQTRIIYADEKYYPDLHQALSTVASERIYIEMIQAPPLEKVISFQRGLQMKNAPVFYAVNVGQDRLVGWCDIFPEENPQHQHRGRLGMGLLPEFRGQGIGSRLLAESLKQAKRIGLEKVDLHVYSSNTHARSLYEKFGFEQEGLIRKYRKLDGQYFDCLWMGKFL